MLVRPGLLTGAAILALAVPLSGAEESPSQAFLDLQRRVEALEELQSTERRPLTGDPAEEAALDERVDRLEARAEASGRVVPIRRSSHSIWDLRFGGRVFNDWAEPSADEAVKNQFGLFDSSTKFRKARLVLNGFAKPGYDFKFELDFADGDADLTDVYVTFPGPRSRQIRVGRQKEPFGFENVGSSRYLTFLERAPVSEILAPKRNVGVTLQPESLAPLPAVWFGWFRTSNSAGATADTGGHALTMRWVTTPRFDEDGRRYAVVGAALSHRTSGDDPLVFRAKTASDLIPPLGDTGDIVADDSDVVGLQGAMVRGPFSLATEYVRTGLHLGDGSRAVIEGSYVTASWVLTGEHKPLDRSKRTFDRLIPRRSFDGRSGGALEIAVRYDWLDLEDDGSGVDGGRLREWTVGCNWYLNQNVRIMADWIRADKSDVGDVDVAMVRFQVDF